MSQQQNKKNNQKSTKAHNQPLYFKPSTTAQADTKPQAKTNKYQRSLIAIKPPKRGVPGESLFLRKLLWASLPNKRQKLRDRQCLRLPQPSSLPSFQPNRGLKL
jgi:hypothetical protein